MLPTPMTPYFLVKLPRKKIDTIGSIFVPNTIKYMAFNLQCGEVVSIGKGAAIYFPEVKIGHILIFHHFVESDTETESRVDHLVHQTNTHNYYVVTAYEYYGKNVETYGVWDGEKILPNRDYIFLNPPIEVDENITSDDIENAVISEQLKVTKFGLLVFEKWKESRETKEYRMGVLKNEIEWLSRSGTHKPHIQKGIAEKEKELNTISENINKQKYVPFKINCYHPELINHFNRRKPIGQDEDVYILNIAAHTKIKFNNVDYIVAKTRYIGLIN